jgi:hypothetical protein
MREYLACVPRRTDRQRDAQNWIRLFIPPIKTLEVVHCFAIARGSIGTGRTVKIQLNSGRPFLSSQLKQTVSLYMLTSSTKEYRAFEFCILPNRHEVYVRNAFV